VAEYVGGSLNMIPDDNKTLKRLMAITNELWWDDWKSWNEWFMEQLSKNDERWWVDDAMKSLDEDEFFWNLKLLQKKRREIMLCLWWVRVLWNVKGARQRKRVWDWELNKCEITFDFEKMWMEWLFWLQNSSRWKLAKSMSVWFQMSVF